MGDLTDPGAKAELLLRAWPTYVLGQLGRRGARGHRGCRASEESPACATVTSRPERLRPGGAGPAVDRRTRRS